MEKDNLILKFPELKYVAKFDKESGKVISIGPRNVDIFNDNEIVIEKELFDDIFLGKINLHHCFVDLYSNKLEIKYTQTLRKIDDVLHRIIETQFSEIDDPDVYLTYNQTLKKLTIELTEKFCGSKKLQIDTDIKKQKVIWSGDTTLDFYITEYNDPHFVFSNISVKLCELENNAVDIDLNIDKKFSIFTRRLFKNYILEVL